MPTRKRKEKARSLVLDAFSGSLLRRAAFALLLLYVLAAPFPWGSVQPGWTGTGKIVVGAFLIGTVTALAPDTRFRLRASVIPCAAVAGIAGIGVLQLVPVPLGLLKWISPLSAEAWRSAGEVLKTFGRTPPASRISLMPWETAGVALLALAFVTLFLSATALLDRRSRRALAAAAVIASGLFQIVLAIATEERISRLHGAFVNPNNLAGFLEIALALTFGLLWYRTRVGLDELRDATSPEDRMNRLARELPKVAAATVLWGVLAAGVIVTQSRGGILAAAGGTIVLLALVLQRGREAGTGWRLVGPVAAILVGLGTAFAIAGAGTLPFLRFLMPDAADLAGDYRVLIWRDSLEAFRAFPWLGSGLGTYREAIRRFQSPEVAGLVDQAHNEYFQILVTGGAVGALCAAVALVSGLRILVRGVLHQKHRQEAAFVAGGLGALLMLLLHGSAEFNFSIPAVPAVLAVVLGGAVAAREWRRADEAEGGPASRLPLDTVLPAPGHE